MKRNSIRIIRIPEGEEEEQGIENLFEKVMMENFANRREKMSPKSRKHREFQARGTQICLLYTSDAADEHRDV